MGVDKQTKQRLTRLQALQWLDRRSNFEQTPTKLEKKNNIHPISDGCSTQST